MFVMKQPKNILITGASSGIGEALAEAYAAEGVTLAISGRNQERLLKVEEKLRAKGARVIAECADVADKETMADWIARVDAAAPLDLVIANAGIGVGRESGMSVAEIAEATFAVNVSGVFHTIHPALEVMKKRGRGQIAIMASVAGLIGLPGFPAYSASKNAVRAYGEALRGAYRKHGIEVNVICPGFVVSRMTDGNPFPMPFLVKTDKAAKRIIKGLRRNEARIGFPRRLYGLVRMLQFLPSGLVTWMASSGPRK